MLHLLFLAAATAIPPAAPSAKAPAVAAQSAKLDGATIAEAIRLLDTDDFDKNAIRSADLAVGVLLASMVDGLQKRYSEEAPHELVEQLRATIHDFTIAKMKAHLPEMKRQAAEVYAQEFTKGELVRLRELHSDPVAVKARERAGVMQPRLMKIGVNTMRGEQPELDAKLQKLVEDYLEAHGKSQSGTSS
jgi:DNA-binding transcriptional MerR regulator